MEFVSALDRLQSANTTSAFASPASFRANYSQRNSFNAGNRDQLIHSFHRSSSAPPPVRPHAVLRAARPVSRPGGLPWGAEAHDRILAQGDRAFEPPSFTRGQSPLRLVLDNGPRTPSMERFYSESKGKWVQHFVTEPNSAVMPYRRADPLSRAMSPWGSSKSREASPTMIKPAAFTQGYAGWCAD